MKLIKDGKYKPSQNDEILTKYYNDIEKMKKQKKSYTTNKNVKEKKKEKQKDTPEQVKYEGIDMTHNFKYQRQKMKTILNHMNIIQSKRLQESSDIGLNTMKTRINQNLSKLETEIFNNSEFDAKKENYKKFYTKKLQQIQTQIQKRQQRKKQQQLQIQKRQRQKKQQQKRIQILKNKKVQNMTEEQKTQMKELFKDRTLVEGFGSKFLELYKDIDKNNKPPFVKQIQEQLNDIEKKINQGKQLSQNQKQFLNKYKKQQQLKQQQLKQQQLKPKDKKTTNLGFVPGGETIYSEPTTSSKKTNLTQQDQQLIKSFLDENRQDRLEKTKASIDKLMKKA